MNLPKFAGRIEALPPYLFAEIDRLKRSLRETGTDIIDLSIGDPDLPTPKIIVDKLTDEARKAEHHRYPSYMGSERFRRAITAWYEDRFNVRLDPEKEVLALIGSKEGLAHLPLAFINPGDIALIPDPGYPVYAAATSFAGGTPFFLPLTRKNGFKPLLQEIEPRVLEKSKLLFLNYPNNPTSTVVDKGYFDEVAAFAKKNEILVAHDAAYSEVTLNSYEPPSFLEAKNARDVAVEFHSLSKTFNMTGWRIGFAVGNAHAIAGLAKVKTNVDSGIFTAIQEAGIVALENWKELRDSNNRIYERRRDLAAEGLRRLGIEFQIPKATFYVWCQVPTQELSADYCARVLREKGVSFTPGVGFGPSGEKYFRISLTASEVRLQEAISRLGKS